MMDFSQVPLLRHLVTLRVLSPAEAGVAVWWWTVDRRPDEPFPQFLNRREILPADALPALSVEPLDIATVEILITGASWPEQLRARLNQIVGGDANQFTPGVGSSGGTTGSGFALGSSTLPLQPPAKDQRAQNRSGPIASASLLRTPDRDGKPGRTLQVGSILGKCLLTERLGQGGTGVVFRALHQSLNIPVAVKILRPQVLAADPTVYHRFRDEARLLAQLNHPNLVRIWDFEDDPDFPFLTLEFVEGLSLGELTQQSGQVRFDKALQIITQVAEGLGFAHRHGIIHRDIKPANVLIARDGTPKIADLGLAVVLSEVQRDPTKRSELLGTPAYMAPEQSQTPNTVDHRADIYALGATFYHALVGSPPFVGGTRLQVMYRHISELPVPPHERISDLPHEASAVILRMLAKNPDERFADYDELIDELRKLAPNRASTRGVSRSTIPLNPPPYISPPPVTSKSSDFRLKIPSSLPPEVKSALRQGIEFAKTGQRDEARERLRTVTLLDPQNELGWLWLAGVCESPQQAMTCLEKVLALNPANEKAQKGLAHYQSRQAEIRTATLPPVVDEVHDTPPAVSLDTHHDVAPEPFALVIDEDSSVSVVVESTLKELGHRVIVVRDLASATSEIKKKLPLLIVIEPALPDGDGYTFCESLRDDDRTASVPVIVLTSKIGFLDKMRARSAGTKSFLIKPCDPVRLAAVARQLCPLP